jgi:hypothetical protein
MEYHNTSRPTKTPRPRQRQNYEDDADGSKQLLSETLTSRRVRPNHDPRDVDGAVSPHKNYEDYAGKLPVPPVTHQLHDHRYDADGDQQLSSAGWFPGQVHRRNNYEDNGGAVSPHKNYEDYAGKLPVPPVTHQLHDHRYGADGDQQLSSAGWFPGQVHRRNNYEDDGGAVSPHKNYEDYEGKPVPLSVPPQSTDCHPTMTDVVKAGAPELTCDEVAAVVEWLSTIRTPMVNIEDLEFIEFAKDMVMLGLEGRRYLTRLLGTMRRAGSFYGAASSVCAKAKRDVDDLRFTMKHVRETSMLREADLEDYIRETLIIDDDTDDEDYKDAFPTTPSPEAPPTLSPLVSSPLPDFPNLTTHDRRQASRRMSTMEQLVLKGKRSDYSGIPKLPMDETKYPGWDVKVRIYLKQMGLNIAYETAGHRSEDENHLDACLYSALLVATQDCESLQIAFDNKITQSDDGIGYRCWQYIQQRYNSETHRRKYRRALALEYTQELAYAGAMKDFTTIGTYLAKEAANVARQRDFGDGNAEGRYDERFDVIMQALGHSPEEVGILRDHTKLAKNAPAKDDSKEIYYDFYRQRFEELSTELQELDIERALRGYGPSFGVNAVTSDTAVTPQATIFHQEMKTADALQERLMEIVRLQDRVERYDQGLPQPAETPPTGMICYHFLTGNCTKGPLCEHFHDEELKVQHELARARARAHIGLPMQINVVDLQRVSGDARAGGAYLDVCAIGSTPQSVAIADNDSDTDDDHGSPPTPAMAKKKKKKKKKKKSKCPRTLDQGIT